MIKAEASRIYKTYTLSLYKQLFFIEPIFSPSFSILFICRLNKVLKRLLVQRKGNGLLNMFHDTVDLRN